MIDYLLDENYRNITVLDISSKALALAQARLGERAERVNWMQADITRADLQPACYDVWHDRAVFHFLTEESDRRRYVDTVLHSLKLGGHIIVATFADDGPTKCSGLDVMRYGPEALHDEFGRRFTLIQSCRETHQTPFGTQQRFVYCYCRLE